MKNSWISTKVKPVPKDGLTYLCIWKGQFALIAYDDEEKLFWLNMLPGQYGEFLMARERENKITYWQPLEHPNES